MYFLIFFGLVGYLAGVLYETNKRVVKTREEIKENFEFIKSKLKCPKLWQVVVKWQAGEKCKYCDENRMITLTYPDGTTKKEPCSCKNKGKKSAIVLEYGIKDKKEYGFCYSNKGKIRIYLYDEDWSYKIIKNQKDYDAFINSGNKNWSSDVLFASKKYANQYAKYLKGRFK